MFLGKQDFAQIYQIYPNLQSLFPKLRPNLINFAPKKFAAAPLATPSPTALKKPISGVWYTFIVFKLHLSLTSYTAFCYS